MKYVALFIVLACLLVHSAPTFAQGFPPIGGGGACTGMVNEQGFQGQQSAVNNGLYLCSGGVWVQQSLILGTTASACSATWAGGIRYSSGAVEYCNGTSWATIGGGGGGTPAGADTQIQFNSGGAFGGDADFVWNSGSNILTITGRASISDRVSLGATAGAAAPISGNVSTLAGAPGATLCNSPEEYGRLIIDSTNNRLYICTTTRGWDYVALTD